MFSRFPLYLCGSRRLGRFFCLCPRHRFVSKRSLEGDRCRVRMPSIPFERDSQSALWNFSDGRTGTEDARVRRCTQELACFRILCISVLDNGCKLWDTVDAIAGCGVLHIGQLHPKVVVGIGCGVLEDGRLAAKLGDEPRCNKRAACHLAKRDEQVCARSGILVGG